MHNLVLVRHGESVWNQENRFTGWQDVDLSEKGRAEARAGGQALREAGMQFDQAFTSVLKRAIRTLWIVTEELDQMWLPVTKSWRLNERHYGNLTGLNKAETAQQYGEDQVKIWRRSFSTPPPPMPSSDLRHPSHSPVYAKVPRQELPHGESLELTVKRFLPLWQNDLAARVREGQRLLLVAHGNSLRALIMHLEKLTPEQIMEVNLPTGIPLVYDLAPEGAEWKVLGKKFLGDPEVVKAAMDSVANQGKVKK